MSPRDTESVHAHRYRAARSQPWWLLNVQAHYGISGELVEGGQFIALYDPNSR